MSKAALELRFDGISGYDPLFVPLERVMDFRGGYVSTQAPKLGNDAERDISVFLTTWDLFTDLSAGAFQKHHDAASRRYYENLPNATALETVAAGLYPLAWTLIPQAAMVNGAKATEQNGAYAFKEMMLGNTYVYGADLKANKLFRDPTTTPGATWTEVTNATAGGTKPAIPFSNAISEVFFANNTLYVGVQSSTESAATSGTGATDSFAFFTESGYGKGGAAVSATHFCIYGKDLYYSTFNTGETSARAVRQKSGTQQALVGLSDTSVNRLVWFNDKILVAKPEGLFEFDPVALTVIPLYQAASKNASNGRVLLVHQGSAWFNMDYSFFEYTGATVLEHSFFQDSPRSGGSSGQVLITNQHGGLVPSPVVPPAVGYIEGASQIFLRGEVIGGYTDSRRMWLVYRVATDASRYLYYLLAYNGRTGGFHPVAVAVGTTDTWNPAGVWLEGNRLRYSIGYHDANGCKTGYLATDGAQPLTFNGSSTQCITSGWINCGREFLSKIFTTVTVSWRDLVSGGGTALRVFYRKWGSATWTELHFGATTSGGDTAGSANGKDSTFTFPPDAGTQQGITATKIMLQFRLTTPSTAGAAYISAVSVTGAVIYPTAYQCTFFALVEDVTGKAPLEREYLAATTIGGLRAALGQTAPVKLTNYDGQTYYGRLSPLSGGDQPKVMDHEEGGPKSRRFGVVFNEWK